MSPLKRWRNRSSSFYHINNLKGERFCFGFWYQYFDEMTFKKSTNSKFSIETKFCFLKNLKLWTKKKNCKPFYDRLKFYDFLFFGDRNLNSSNLTFSEYKFMHLWCFLLKCSRNFEKFETQHFVTHSSHSSFQFLKSPKFPVSSPK